METFARKKLSLKPKSRKNCNLVPEFPFPIFNKRNEVGKWQIHFGYLKETCVWVTDDRSIDHIYSMGFFGEPSQSRHVPKVCRQQGKSTHSPCSNEPSSTTKEDGNTSSKHSVTSSDSDSEISDADESDEDIEEVLHSPLKPNIDVIDISDESNKSATGAENEGGSSQLIYDQESKVPGNKTLVEDVDHVSDSEVVVIDSDSDDAGDGDATGASTSDEIAGDAGADADIEIITCVPNVEQIAESSMDVTKEHLILSFEEAFFLSYGLGCLVVFDENNIAMQIQRLWLAICNLMPKNYFPPMYAAYHHYRSKGWVVRSGIKYGTDFVLYKDGPPFYHSSFAVLVCPVVCSRKRTWHKKQMTWHCAEALHRVVSATGKELIFMHVIQPRTLSVDKLATPFCIEEFLLDEVQLERWVPEQQRSADNS